MKNTKITIALILFLCSVASAQISIGDEFTNEVITIKTDTMSVKESFELLDKLCEGRMSLYDRKVIYKGETYFKFGLTFNKRKKTYLVDGRKMRKVKI